MATKKADLAFPGISCGGRPIDVTDEATTIGGYLVKILFLAPYYPHPGHPFSGVFNERSACALKKLCTHLEVLVPRPYAPPLISSLFARWKAYAQIVRYEVRDGIPVNRPAYPLIPRVGSAFWSDKGAFVFCRRTAREIHNRIGFDAILSFDLGGAGGLAWRLGKDLGIPACGWATGSDLAQPPGSAAGRVVLRALTRLDLVFYQSCELLETAAELLELNPDVMLQDKHIILARGIPEPPELPTLEIRSQLRSAWGITNDQVLVLNIGRIVREKGVFELLEVISKAASRDPRITCVIAGALKGFDETSAVQRKIEESVLLRKRVKLLPACQPDQVWDYLCAADIFAFTSYQRFEGMPNSLLEAMAMEIPAVAFSIRPVCEIEAGTKSLLHVPVLNTSLFAEAILRLASSPRERRQIGERAKSQVLDGYIVEKNMAVALRHIRPIVEGRQRLSLGGCT